MVEGEGKGCLRNLTESVDKFSRSVTGLDLGQPERGNMNLFVLKTWLQTKFTKDDRGANLVEYILLVALIALAVIAAVVFLRGQVSDKFNETGSKLSSNGN